MGRVVGLGGIFFKAKDPKAMYEWYRKHLGVEGEVGTGAMWPGNDTSGNPAFNVWSIFPQDTKYLGSSSSPFMINFRVEGIEELLKTLREAGVQVDEKVDRSEYGTFGWITDPEGNRVELWEPKS